MRVKSFLISGSGMLGAQMIALFSLPFLTRLYEPSAYAQWAIVQAVVLFIGAVASLRYDLAIVVERDHETASALFWIAVLAGAMIAFLSAAVLLLIDSAGLSQQVWIKDEVSLLTTIVWILSAAISPALMGWCLRGGRFALMATTQITIATVTLSVQTAGGIFSGDSADWRWLLIGSTTGQVIGLLAVTIQFSQRNGRPTSFETARYSLIASARKHIDFVKFSLPFTVFGGVRDRLPLFIVGNWASARDMGLYSQAWRLSNVPAALTGAVVRPVLFQASSTDGLASLEETINRILLLQVAAGTPLLAVVMVYPTEILGWVLGESWKEIGTIIAPLLVPAFVFSISNWMDRLLDSAGRQDLNLTTEIVSGVTSVAALAITFSLGLGIHAAVAVQSMVLTLNYVFFIYLVYTVAGYNRMRLASMLVMAIAIFVVVFGVAQRIAA